MTGAIGAQVAVQKDADGSVIATLELMKDGPEGGVLRCRLQPVDVGVDSRGKAITSCVVEHLDGTALPVKTKKPRKLSGAQTIALRQLHDAIAIGGEVPPESNRTPSNRRCVKEEVWREYCYRGGISDGDTQDARRKAFDRAKEVLIGEGLIGCWDPWVWVIKPDT
jgi:hypothetical protein